MSELIVVLPYRLKSKSNFRRNKSSKEWLDYKNFEKNVKLFLLSSKPTTWVDSKKEDPLSERMKVLVSIASCSVLDVGNYSKSLLDAAENALFSNDSEVAALTCIGKRTRKSNITVVGFKQVEARAGLGEIHSESEILSAKVLEKFLVCISEEKGNNK